MPADSLPILTGLERTLQTPSLVPDGSIALATNYASVTSDLGRGVDALLAAGLPVTALLTPEHGYWGAAQAGESDGDTVDETTGVRVLDTHRVNGADLDALLMRAEADQLVIDFQDIGTRFYTYMWSMYGLLCAAARTGHPVVILDRPNPLGGLSAGPGLESDYSSAIGRLPVPLQHGLTLGELALWFNQDYVPEVSGRPASVHVVALEHWQRELQRPDTPWVMPSPNMPTLDTAVLYPGTGLIEGTTLSEGRGTTRPFELLGAPWTDARFAAALREQQLPGIAVREAVFAPIFSKWANERVHGIQIHLLDAAAFDPIETGYTVIKTVAEVYPDQELWRPRFAPDRPQFMDLQWGSPAFREGIDNGSTLEEILANSPEPAQPPAEAYLYA